MKEFRKDEQGNFICEECGRTLSTYNRSVADHIRICHNDSKKEYYDKWLKEKREGLCKICSKETEFIKFKSGYKECCSQLCSSKLRKQTCLKIYGVEYSLQNLEVREKGKETSRKKYGIDCPQQAFEVKEKTKQTCLKRYGVTGPGASVQALNKNKKTCLKRYGVEYSWQVPEVKEKSKKTCLEHYNVEYSLQSLEIREKGKETKKERYGDENYHNMEQTKETNKQKYGVEYSLQSLEVREKGKETKKERYGDENYVNIEKMKQTKKERYNDENYNNVEKNKETCLKNYGVEHPLQNSEIFEKSFKTRIKLHNYLDTNLTYQGSYEKHFLDTYYPLFLDIENGLSFKYKTLDGKNHMYHSDFFMPSLNLIVEIKNSHLAKRDKDEIEAKKQGVLNAGYNYIIIINKNYNKFNKLFT
jgi:hypothetical protein